MYEYRLMFLVLIRTTNCIQFIGRFTYE